MKLTLSITGLLLIAMLSTANAQDNQNEYRSIFNKKSDRKTSHGGYGSFGVGYTNIDEKDAILLNFKGAWVINHSISLGFAGTGFFNGGFFFEPILLAKSPVHLTFPILIGGGGVSTIPQNYWDWDDSYYPYDYDIFFLVEPGVELEFNMVKFFRVALGASYRWTNGIILQESADLSVAPDALDGFNFYMNFKFGKW